jgi:hypothetical protein
MTNARIPTNSSKLASIGYDESSHTLEIEFRDGSVFEYYHVPPGVYHGLKDSSSKGYYFETNISRSHHPYKRLR